MERMGALHKRRMRQCLAKDNREAQKLFEPIKQSEIKVDAVTAMVQYHADHVQETSNPCQDQAIPPKSIQSLKNSRLRVLALPGCL